MITKQRIIINADDFGISDGVCEAIENLLKIDAISNTTVMTLAPGIWERTQKFPYAFKSKRAGVHLQLSGGSALTKKSDEVLSFQDKISGNFLKKDEILNADISDVKNEWEAQILEFIKNLGIMPTHIDSHMGYHRSEKFSTAYIELAMKYNIPIRGGENPFLQKMKYYKVPGTTAFVRGWSGKGLPSYELKKKLNDLKEKCDPNIDIIELTCHPGFVSQQLIDSSSLTYGREHDYQDILDLHRTNWLNENGFKLIQFNDLIKKESSNGGRDGEF